MKRFAKTLVAGIAAVAVLGPVSVATAAPPAEPNGFDGVPDVSKGAGSDTTYLVMQQLESLYNASEGCVIPNAVNDPTCLASQPGDVEGRANYDHDVLVSEYPTGSSNGVRRLIGSGGLSAEADLGYARSSRSIASGEDAAAFFAYGKDGIAIIGYSQGGRSPGSLNITKAQAQAIWLECATVEPWSFLTGVAGDSAPIVPWGMNTSSGTYATFQTYLGGDPNTCTPPEREIFENNNAPVIESGLAANSIWWMSYAEFKTIPNKRLTAQNFGQVDGVGLSDGTIATNAYPIRRFVWHVVRDTAETATGGVNGAAWEFTDFLCRAASGQATNVNTGANYFNDIGATLTRYGFQRPSSTFDAPFNFGRCKRES